MVSDNSLKLFFTAVTVVVVVERIPSRRPRPVLVEVLAFPFTFMVKLES